MTKIKNNEAVEILLNAIIEISTSITSKQFASFALFRIVEKLKENNIILSNVEIMNGEIQVCDKINKYGHATIAKIFNEIINEIFIDNTKNKFKSTLSVENYKNLKEFGFNI